MSRCWVKYCGITRKEDALVAAELGVDAIGLVFYEKSSRHVSIAQAQEIIAILPVHVSVVGLFVNEAAERVKQVLQQVNLDLLQFHGDESPDFCQQFAKPYLKALRIQPGVDMIRACHDYAGAEALLLDAYHPQQTGGTGESFDWQLIPNNCPKPIILAGGLRPENVATAIQQVKPYGVDVSSGIEQQPGIKDRKKMQSFMNEVTRD